MMEYQEALVYLRDLTKFGFNFGLDRIEELMRRLGDPQKTMSYIHVGGTNGKGSVVSMLNAMLTAAGEKAGMFTSPHLHSYRERFRIGDELMSHEEVAALLTEIRPIVEDMIADGFEQPTEFEVNTAMAFAWFARKGVKIAVLEVGMGGEIDATNVIENTKIAVLTNVALEHTQYLGDTKEKICLTKAGIIKKDAAVISGCEEESLKEILRRRVEETGAKSLSLLQDDFRGSFEDESPTEQRFTYEDEDVKWEHLRLPLLGRHQIANAALAVRAARGLGLDEAAIREGLLNTVWPCRLEKVSDDPFTIIDGAHNDHGMAVLTEYLRNHWLGHPIVVLIGMLADKEREKAIALLGPLTDKVVVTRPNSPRAGDYEMIAEFFRPYCDEIYLEEAIPDAVAKAQSLAKAAGEDALLLITGSLYMVADARGVILNIESE